MKCQGGKGIVSSKKSNLIDPSLLSKMLPYSGARACGGRRFFRCRRGFFRCSRGSLIGLKEEQQNVRSELDPCISKPRFL